MEEPWFGPRVGFRYPPITWEGWAVVAAQYGISLPLGLVSMGYTDTKPLLGWGAAVAAFVVYFGCYAVMILKAKIDYPL